MLLHVYNYILAYTGIVRMSGDESEIIVSNNMDSGNRLFLRIQKKQREVTVAKNPGVSYAA